MRPSEGRTRRMMSMTHSKTNLAAYQIMNNAAETLHRAALDCYLAIYFVTDYADRWESLVLYENALNAWDIMEEAMK